MVLRYANLDDETSKLLSVATVSDETITLKYNKKLSEHILLYVSGANLPLQLIGNVQAK